MHNVKNDVMIYEDDDGITKVNVKRNIDHYNLDMIIALGYRVQSDVAVRFRIWATKRLHEYIQKWFTLDDEIVTKL